MPRKKQAFINKSRAKTFQLVPRSGGEGGDDSAPILLPVDADASRPTDDSLDPADFEDYLRDIAAENGEGVDATSLQSSYKKADYELGEFGFPDDGYNYSKHFKTIGGGGGVFMDAVTGKENPEAVVGSSTGRESRKAVSAKGGIVLQEDVQEAAEEEDSADKWIRKEDFLRHQQAIEEIKRERRRNKDLDEIFAALDSDGELDSSDVGPGGDVTKPEEVLMQGDEDGDLEDDFMAIADQAAEGEKQLGNQLDGVIEQYREPRLLDEQFEKFMEGYGFSDDEDDDDYFPSANLEDVDDVADFQAHMTKDELAGVFDDGDLLNDLAGLKISTKKEEGQIESSHLLDAAAAAEHAEDDAVKAVDRETERVAEYEQFANAEFERGMKGLLDSYNRVSAEDALGAIDGVDVAMEAITRGEEEEKARIEKRLEKGLDEESGGHDSELESQFDDMFKEPEEKWDCETILSTYSNLENHPSVIDAPTGKKRRSLNKPAVIRLDPRTQAPEDYMPTSTEANRVKHIDFGTRRETVPEAQSRPKNESKEEKRARKAAVKEAARERRALKSEMKKAFGSEHAKQDKHAASMGASKVVMQL